MREFFFNGQVRLDWGFGNPNVTGSFIALLMLGVWVLAYLPREWGSAGFWIALFTNAVLGVFLVQTFSRGALVAYLAGAAILIAAVPRPWPGGRLAATIIVSMTLLLYATSLGFADRTLHGILGEDKSVTNRWLIYKVIPRMAWDAPEGWGHERGAEAFRQWYQPVGKTEIYGRLVNSHATWLVEWPWYSRFLYGLAWTAVLFLCLPTNKLWFSPPLAVWTSFGLGACFTTIAHHWQLWIVPSAAFLVLLTLRLFKKAWPGKGLLKWSGIVWATGGICWWMWALFTPSLVQLTDGVVIVRGQSPQTISLITGLDETVMGRFYGQRIRERCATEPLQLCMRWHLSTSALPAADVCVVAGNVAGQIDVQASPTLAKARRWVLLNPGVPSSSFLQMMDVDAPPAVLIQLGSFAGGSGRYFWQAFAAKHSTQVKIQEIKGSGQFLRDWSRAVF